MIILTALLHRNPALTHDEFLHHWHEVHGPLIRDTPSLARHIVRYEQYDGVDDRGVGGGFDGVALQWLWSMDSLFDFVAEPAYAEVLAPDEQYLLDMDRIQVSFRESLPRAVVIRADSTDRPSVEEKWPGYEQRLGDKWFGEEH